MAKHKNQTHPNPTPQQQSSPETDPRREQPKWGEQDVKTPPRHQPERTPPPIPPERGNPSVGITNRSLEEEQREQDELPERGSRQSER